MPWPLHEPTLLNQAGQVVVMVALVVVIVAMFRRAGQVNGRKLARANGEVVVMAIMGLTLCGRFVGSVHRSMDWLWVAAITVGFAKLALDAIKRDQSEA